MVIVNLTNIFAKNIRNYNTNYILKLNLIQTA